jgi:retron-type reverse transcriptase
MNLIKDRVEDQAFIDLLYKYLRAGYMTELYGVQRQAIGVPQGGVTSPILSNIYMDGLDRYMEDVIIPKWTRGVRRKQHPMYTKITRSGKAPTEVRIPRVIGNDPDFRRVRYVRYAEGFLIGIIGSKEDCEEIRADLAN